MFQKKFKKHKGCIGVMLMKINKHLNNINNTSLAKICFYKKPFNNFIKDLHFYNIILRLMVFMSH